VEQLFTDFVEIRGDRRFADDHAIVAGPAAFHGAPVMIVGHQKGSDTKQKIYRNFGYARPEGYRKAMRTMEMAQKFRRPIICFVDTPAAYPGIESEERGVAEAIAVYLREMMMLEVPVIVMVIGEGGSGGALVVQTQLGSILVGGNAAVLILGWLEPLLSCLAVIAVSSLVRFFRRSPQESHTSGNA